MPTLKPLTKLAGFEGNTEKGLLEVLNNLISQVNNLSRAAALTPLRTSNYNAREGETVRIKAGLTLNLPRARQENQGAIVGVMVETEGTVRVTATNSTVNRQSYVRTSSRRLVIFQSNGDGNWAGTEDTEADEQLVERVVSGSGVSAVDAQYHLASAHADLPSALVATASTEITPTNGAGVVSWVLNSASVVLAKLQNLAGLSVLGRASNSSGAMAAITATAAEQVLRSSPDGTSIGWESILSTQHLVTISGLQNPLLLPAGFRHGDTLGVTMTGDTTIQAILANDGSTPPEGFVMNLMVRDQLGGSAPGWSLTIPDGGASDGEFRTPGQVQGTTPGPSYVMRSEEEGAQIVMVRPAASTGAWRFVSGTAAQAVVGAIELAAGNGATRTALFSGIKHSTVTQTPALQFINFGPTNSIVSVVTPNVGTDSYNISFQRAAFTGDVTATQNSNAMTIANDAVTDAKLRNSAALSVIGRSANSTGDPADIAAGSDGHVLRRSGTTLGFGTVAAAGLADAIITPAKLAVEASGEAVVIAKRVSFAATGATGTLIDVTVWNAAAPFALRIHRAILRVSTAVGGTTAQLRTATAGGGTLLLEDVAAAGTTFSTAATGRFIDNALATATVASAGSLFLRIDRAIAGELLLQYVRT